MQTCGLRNLFDLTHDKSNRYRISPGKQKNVINKTYIQNLQPFTFGWKLMLGLSFRVCSTLCKYSIIRTKRKGEIWSPCLRPLLSLRISVGSPLMENLKIYFFFLLWLILSIKVSKHYLNLKLFWKKITKFVFKIYLFKWLCNFYYILIFNNIYYCYKMSKVIF